MKNFKMIAVSALSLWINQVKGMEHQVEVKVPVDTTVKMKDRNQEVKETAVKSQKSSPVDSAVKSASSLSKGETLHSLRVGSPEPVQSGVLLGEDSAFGKSGPQDEVSPTNNTGISFGDGPESEALKLVGDGNGETVSQEEILNSTKSEGSSNELIKSSQESMVSTSLLTKSMSDLWKSMSDGVTTMFNSISDAASYLKSILLQEEPLKTELNKIIQGKGDYSQVSSEARAQAEKILNDIQTFDADRSKSMKKYTGKGVDGTELLDHFTFEDRQDFNSRRTSIQQDLSTLEQSLQVSDAKMQQMYSKKNKLQQKKETALARSNKEKEKRADSALTSGGLFPGAD